MTEVLDRPTSSKSDGAVEPLLRVSNLTKYYGHVAGCLDISFEMRPGCSYVCHCREKPSDGDGIFHDHDVRDAVATRLFNVSEYKAAA